MAWLALDDRARPDALANRNAAEMLMPYGIDAIEALTDELKG
jgi:hypothetical protein